MPRTCKALLGSVLGLLMAGCGMAVGPLRASPPPGTGATREVIGFWAKGAHVSLSPLSRYPHAVTMFSPFWYSIDPAGRIVSKVDTRVLDRAQALHIPIAPLFNTPAAQSFLGSLFSRVAVARAIADIVRRNHYAGVNLDFEPPETRYAAGLAGFVIDLRDMLPPGTKIYLDVVPASGGAYDWPHLAPEVTAFILMSYDEHDDGSMPGPVAATSWVTAKAQRLLTKVPANKLDLGLAFYGYDWLGGTTHAKTLALNSIPPTISSHATYDPTTQEMTGTYVSSRGLRNTFWYESPQGLAAKIRVAESLHLRGVAVWRLGYQTAPLLSLLTRLHPAVKPSPKVVEGTKGAKGAPGHRVLPRKTFIPWLFH